MSIDKFGLNLLSNVVIIYFNMFGHFMKYRISYNMHSSFIVTKKKKKKKKSIGITHGQPKSSRRLLSYMDFHGVVAIAHYSASTLDRATTCYFLLLHETRLLPTSVQ